MRSIHAVGVSLVAVGLSIVGCSKSSDYNPPPGGTGTGKEIDAGTPVDAAPADAGGDASTPDGPSTNSPTVIELVKPAAPFLIAGVMQVDLHVTDADGVASVTATFGDDSHPIHLALGQSDHWVGEFDTTVLAGTVSPNLQVSVVDRFGGTGEHGFPITLDNSSPVASMDPPKVRMFNDVDKTCSDAFDPLGGDAPSDRQTVAQLSEFRARVVDRSNVGTLNGTVFIPLAGVDSVKLNVLHATGAPLAVDSDGDGTCDRINPKVAPVVITLAPAPPAGSGFFGPTTLAGSNLIACTGVNTQTVPPAPLCGGEPQATIAISTPFGHVPEIFGIPQVTAENCLGYIFDAGADNVAEGWACVAVETTDGLGNRNVSAPIRVCINKSKTGAATASCTAVGMTADPDDPALPDCTGTLTPAGTVNSTRCTPETFFDSGTPNDYELIRQ